MNDGTDYAHDIVDRSNSLTRGVGVVLAAAIIMVILRLLFITLSVRCSHKIERTGGILPAHADISGLATRKR